MGPRTRSSAQNSPVKNNPPPSTTAAVTVTAVDEKSLPKLFILPRPRSSSSRFILLPSPRDNTLKRYFFDPQTGPYELTRVSSANSVSDPRSILYTSDGSNDDSTNSPIPLPESLAEGYVVKTAELFIATLIDMVFLALPVLWGCSSPARTEKKDEKGSRRLLQSIDDLLDAFEGDLGHLRYVLTHPEYRPKLEKSLETICDTVDAGDEKMFRLNETKLAKEFLAKARRVVARGLPASMEERFVTRVLETPMMSVHREETTTATATATTSFTTDSPAPAAAEKTSGSQSSATATQSQSQSQSSSASTPAATSLVSEVSSSTTITAITSPSPTPETKTPSNPPPPPTNPRPDSDSDSDLHIPLHLLRLRVALNHLTTTYLPPTLCSLITSTLTLAPQPLIDFTPLTTHLTHISSLRAAAFASRSLFSSNDFSRRRKRGDSESDESEDLDEDRAEKKKRRVLVKEEEERKLKKAAGESRGVRELKKVDVTGMRKMSDFFGRKTGTAGGKGKGRG